MDTANPPVQSDGVLDVPGVFSDPGRAPPCRYRWSLGPGVSRGTNRSDDVVHPQGRKRWFDHRDDRGRDALDSSTPPNRRLARVPDWTGGASDSGAPARG